MSTETTNPILTRTQNVDYTTKEGQDLLKLSGSDLSTILATRQDLTDALSTSAVTLVIAEGASGRAEQQTITASVAPASGVYTLNYGGFSTTALDWNANATAVQTALRLISGLGSVTVAGSFGTAFTVTFTGVAGNISLLTVSNNTLIPTSPTLTVAESVAGRAEQQTITASAAPAGGSYKLNYGGSATSSLAWNANATAIQTALRLLTGLSAVTVAGSFGTAFTVTFTGVAGNISLMTVTSNTVVDSMSASVTLTVAESVSGRNEQQTVTASAAPASGQYRLRYGGLPTSELIAWNATAAEVQTALRTISGLELVTVAGSFGSAFTVTFTGVAGDIALMTVTEKTLERAIITLTVAESVSGRNEIQTITPSDDPFSGRFKLSYGGYTTGFLPHNIVAEDLKVALRRLPGLELITVTGTYLTAFTVTFTGVAGDISLMTVTQDNVASLDSSVEEDSHIAEDEFRRQCFALIYEGKGDAKHISDFALQSGNLDYTRGYKIA